MYLDIPYTLTRSDADLYVEQVGPEDGPVIFYLHGGPGYNSHSFRDLIGEDLDRYRMIYADQRGSGRSYASADFTINDLADDIQTTLDTLEIESASLLAHGFGAQIAIRAAGTFPTRISGLILVSPWFSMPLLTRTLQRLAATLSGRVEQALPPEEVLDATGAPDPAEVIAQAFEWVNPKQLFDTLEFPNPAARLRLEYSDSTALLGPHASGELIDPWELDALAELDRLGLPLVILAGKDDRTVVPDQLEAGLRRTPGALMSLLEGGHYPWLDDPETFLNLLGKITDRPREWGTNRAS
ncbi:MAG: alpha/beta hydrolase [Truepera sp.]|nr:alpha/beta hydrolase [Truepera sp.]